MYSFAQRSDTRVVDEPLYAHYLRHQPTMAEHPGKAEVLTSQNQNGEQVAKYLTTHPFGKELVVFKQMTHHLVHLSEDSKVAMFTGGSQSADRIANVLLIRDPRLILASASKVVDHLTAEDIGMPQQWALYQQLESLGALTAILDARRLLLNPPQQLSKLCHLLGFPFDGNMLQWQAGARPEDGVWAKYWYTNVHQSTGFQPYQAKEFVLSQELMRIADTCMPIYLELLAKAL